MKERPHLCSFESRRAQEIRSLIERAGAIATVAPSMQEVALSDNTAAFEFAERLLAGDLDVMIFLTGIGARVLIEALETRFERTQLVEAFNRTTVVIRGPKPAAVLREWSIQINHRAPEPNTWRDVIRVIEDERVRLDHSVVAVQEYGQASAELYAELEVRGASVLAVPVYRWSLPDDTAPLESAIRAIIAGNFDALLFTSANQIHNVLKVTDQFDSREAWLDSAGKLLVASIGPTCSDALRSAGLGVDLEASPPKMGQLVRATVTALCIRPPV